MLFRSTGPRPFESRTRYALSLPFDRTRSAPSRAGVRPPDVATAVSQLECGIVWINTHHRNDPSSAWGGFKNSGVGRENGIDAFHSYSQAKSVIVSYQSEDDARRLDDWFNDVGADVRYG